MRRQRSQQNAEEGPRFEATEPEQASGFDDLDETKYGRKQEKFGRFNLGAGTSNMLGGAGDDDALMELFDMMSDDDEPKGKGAAGAGLSRRMLGDGFLSVGAVTAARLNPPAFRLHARRAAAPELISTA